MKKMDPSELTIRPFHLLDKEWGLLATGKEHPNLMTVAWGGFGTIWNKPVVIIYVRPTRHTFSILKDQPEFTLNIMPETYRKALEICGNQSGRTVDKWKAAGLKALNSDVVTVPRVDGADLSFECRVIASFIVDPVRFLDKAIEKLYPERDYHTAFVGEVCAVWATDRFCP